MENAGPFRLITNPRLLILHRSQHLMQRDKMFLPAHTLLEHQHLGTVITDIFPILVLLTTLIIHIHLESLILHLINGGRHSDLDDLEHLKDQLLHLLLLVVLLQRLKVMELTKISNHYITLTYIISNRHMSLMTAPMHTANCIKILDLSLSLDHPRESSIGKHLRIPVDRHPIFILHSTELTRLTTQFNNRLSPWILGDHPLPQGHLLILLENQRRPSLPMHLCR